MNFSDTSVKTFEKFNCSPKIFFNMDIMDLCLLHCFYILFKSGLESVMNALLSEVGLTKIKSSWPIKA